MQTLLIEIFLPLDFSKKKILLCTGTNWGTFFFTLMIRAEFFRVLANVAAILLLQSISAQRIILARPAAVAAAAAAAAAAMAKLEQLLL